MNIAALALCVQETTDKYVGGLITEVEVVLEVQAATDDCRAAVLEKAHVEEQRALEVIAALGGRA